MEIMKWLQRLNDFNEFVYQIINQNIIQFCYKKQKQKMNNNQNKTNDNNDDDQNTIQSLLQFAYSQKNYSQALQLIKKLIQNDPQNHQLYHKKAFIQFNLGRLQQCLISAQRSYQNTNYRNSIDLVNIMIQAYLDLNKIEKAQNIIKDFLSKNDSIKKLIRLNNTVKKLKNIQTYSLPENEQKILTEMKQWLHKSGAKYDKVKIINESKSYRAAIATKSIKKDEIIVFIPKSQLMTLQLAKQDQICAKIISQNVQLLSPKHSMLSIFLLSERESQKSKFKPYIDILPTDHSCFPINYTTEELTELIGSTFLFQIRQKVLDLKKDYELICHVSSDFQEKYTFKDYCWARMMVGSRVFGVIIDGVKTQILAPFADMLNHKIPKQTVWNYSPEMSGFYIQSLKNIQIGSELFDSYGKKCNSRFLLNYGFVMQQNDRNQICLKIDLDEKDPTFNKKINMIKMTQSSITRIFKITKNIEENLFFEMMGFLRFKNIDKVETLNLLEKISNIQKSNEPYKPSRTPPTTIEVQKKIWAELKNLCDSQLKSYPTTIQQDEQLLKQPLSSNIRNIILLRIGQKMLYHHFYYMSLQAIQILNLGYEKARERARNSLELDYCRYIEKILGLMPHENNQMFTKNIQNNEKKQGQFREENEENCQLQRQRQQF